MAHLFDLIVGAIVGASIMYVVKDTLSTTAQLLFSSIGNFIMKIVLWIKGLFKKQ